MKQRTFTPPPLFARVCTFAIQEYMALGIGPAGEYEFTVADCLQVAMLYPKVSPEFRLPQISALATLYNAWADTQDIITRRMETCTAVPPSGIFLKEPFK